MVPGVIERCKAREPDQRPSFSTIKQELEQLLLPGGPGSADLGSENEQKLEPQPAGPVECQLNRTPSLSRSSLPSVVRADGEA